MGISDRTYAKIENGERHASMDELEALSKIFNVEMKDLLFSEPKFIFENKDSVTVNNQGNIVQQNADEVNANYIKHLEEEVMYLKSLLSQKDK